MPSLLAPALYALFVWWFSTGVVLLLDNLPRRTFRWSMIAGTAVFVVALQQLAATASDTSLGGAYAAFTWAVLAWAWQEMSFFMGFVTGPRRTPAPADCSTWARFRAGVAACLWHELAIIATAIVILATTWGAANQIGAWTFLVLWAMRQSAKLNVFLGVLNLGESFLPAHLHYLVSFMARRRMNALMPLSIGLGIVATVLLAQAANAASGGAAAGLSMLATMMGLAVIEHVFLVLPIPFARVWARLWAWSTRFKHTEGPDVNRPKSRGAHHGLPAVLP